MSVLHYPAVVAELPMGGLAALPESAKIFRVRCSVEVGIGRCEKSTLVDVVPITRRPGNRLRGTDPYGGCYSRDFDSFVDDYLSYSSPVNPPRVGAKISLYTLPVTA